MGGRGTFAAGNNIPYKYKTVETIDGVKVLQPIEPKSSFNLPVESHSSTRYLLLDKAGVFRQYREYNEKHEVIFEIGYHFESGMSKKGEPVLHVHEYSPPGIQNRGKARPITEKEIERYRNLFRGVKL